MYLQKRTHTHTHTHTLTLTHTHMYTHTHSHSHTRTQTHTHTYTYTHTHTHTIGWVLMGAVLLRGRTNRMRLVGKENIVKRGAKQGAKGKVGLGVGFCG
jgi:metal-responsive CopG/Arc/MetJ family transcriptional regulator